MQFYSNFQAKFLFLLNNIRSVYGLEINYSDNKSLQITDLFCDDINTKTNLELKKIEDSQLHKLKLLNRRESEIFKNPIKLVLSKMKDKIDMEEGIKNTSLQNLFGRFLSDQMKKYGSKRNNKLLLNIKTKLMATIQQYTNSFVDFDINK